MTYMAKLLCALFALFFVRYTEKIFYKQINTQNYG